jgi:stearoyl-CoA desaturase (Delta-9 desaturase)
MMTHVIETAAPVPFFAAAYKASRIAFSLLPLMVVHASLIGLFFVDFTWTGLILFVVMTRLTGLGVTVGFHRYFSHHSFKTSRTFQFILGFLGCTALQKGPLWWVAHHREHHRHSDTEKDVHSPVVGGFWYGHIGWLFARDLMHPSHECMKDLTKYPELRWLDQLWMLPGLLAAAACYAIDGMSGLLWGYCFSTVTIFQLTFAVNSIGHRWGPQRFATGEGSRNNWFLGYVAMGDGWHNNHHRSPSSARHGMAWYELDIAYMMIRNLQRLGLVWGLRLPSPEVMAVVKGTGPAVKVDAMAATVPVNEPVF